MESGGLGLRLDSGHRCVANCCGTSSSMVGCCGISLYACYVLESLYKLSYLPRAEFFFCRCAGRAVCREGPTTCKYISRCGQCKISYCLYVLLVPEQLVFLITRS